MSVISDARAQLARAVRQRRLDQSLTIASAARSAGIDRTTWYGIERADRQTAPHNHARIERVLGWSRGSIEAILNGGDPQLLGDDDLPEPTTPEASPYLDLETGEEYTDLDERQLWDIQTLPADERRKLIYYIRAERQRQRVERRRQRAS